MSEQDPEPEWGGPDWSETGRQLAESGKLKPSPDLMKMMRRLRVLIVGCGAIGPVYGYHLREAGAHVTVFVKPKYAAQAEDGYTLHPWGVAGKRSNRHFQPHAVISDLGELREHTYDQVWLCVSSPALRDGFLERLYQSCITAAIWVSFQPRVEEWQYLTQTIPSHRLVMGMVNFIAYRAPLPGEELWPEGVAYFIPPWSMTKFSSEDEDEHDLYAAAVANALQRGVGRLVGAVVPDAASNALAANVVLTPVAIALESLQWSVHAMRNNQSVVELTRAAIFDLQVALEHKTGVPTGKWRIVQKPWFWKAALFAAPYATAFPLEGYLKHHFTKLREQTDFMVDDLVELCHDNGVVPSSLEALRDQWRARRSEIESLDPDDYDTRTGRRLSVSTPVPAAVSDPAASSVEFRIEPESSEPADGSQSLVVGDADVSAEFESEATPPPSASQQTRAADESDDSVPGGDGRAPDEPPREREDTPMPSAIHPVPGVTDEPIEPPREREITPSAELLPVQGIKRQPLRESNVTPMPAEILPVPGIVDEPIAIANASPPAGEPVIAANDEGPPTNEDESETAPSNDDEKEIDDLDCERQTQPDAVACEDPIKGEEAPALEQGLKARLRANLRAKLDADASRSRQNEEDDDDDG